MKTDSILQEIESALQSISNLEELENIRIAELGKKGRITNLMKSIGSMKPEDRKTAGQQFNQLKNEVAELIENQKTVIEDREIEDDINNAEKIYFDVPWPPDMHPINHGRIHPISKVTEELMKIANELDFEFVDGHDIETKYHNFTALNFNEGHPAMEMHDTFYLNSDKLLRTHTSPVQVHAMKKREAPMRIVTYGRTYRCDSDKTHTPMFHQMEGFAVDQNINMGHLKWTIETICKIYFDNDNLKFRYRPSYFPFTEPSVEVDISCSFENDELIITDDGNEWMEILGCGMIHPNVLKNCGKNPDELQGFAFGLGIDRMTMLKYGISDLRDCFGSDIRWLNHYGFHVFDD